MAAPLQYPHDYSLQLRQSLNSHLSEDHGDLRIIDNEGSTSLGDSFDCDEDSLPLYDHSWPRLISINVNDAALNTLMDRTTASFCQWKRSARYIPLPEYRLKGNKRTVRQRKQRRFDMFIETNDLSNPSLILILHVDGFYRLACPFFVWNSARHASCALEHDLNSLASLLHHLRRYHPRPSYCPICWRVFDSGDAACDAHIRAQACPRRDIDPTDVPRGVAREQLYHIIDTDDRSLPEDERWRRAYSIVFPEQPRPSRAAAYLSEGWPLTVSMARDFWEVQGRDLVEQCLAEEEAAGGAHYIEDQISAICEIARRQLIEHVVMEVQCEYNHDSERMDEVEEGWDLI